ncbi:MAG TPA: integrase [Planctomycetales bacterium]|nr:integrase [Planctomycetales bacterium]
MASISKGPDGHRTIQFIDRDRKRKSIRLGKASQRLAESIKGKVEALNAAQISRCPLDDDAARWVSQIGDDLAAKLAAVGLVAERASTLLGDFLDSYIARRTDVKPNTRRNLEACKARLVDFFGAAKPMREISPGDADAWLLWLRERYANGTAGRTAKRAKQFFRAAVRARLIPSDSFLDVKPPTQANESRKFFVGRDAARQVMEACPDAEWRLIFALCRFGGLRCPSELMLLEWANVDWEKNRFLVHAPKTEHHEDGGDRWVPIFPELRPHLEAVFDQAEPGTVHVIHQRRGTNLNLRTQLQRIIRRAGLTAWPKLFQNLRASRQTELAAEYPLHVVCAWIGNSEAIAKRHYLQVTESDFVRAANSGAVALQNPVQSAFAGNCQEVTEMQKAPENRGFMQVLSTVCKSLQDNGIPPRGLEPLS